MVYFLRMRNVPAEDCSICYDTLNNGLPVVAHVSSFRRVYREVNPYHAICIRNWIGRINQDNRNRREEDKVTPSCPACRSVIRFISESIYLDSLIEVLPKPRLQWLKEDTIPGVKATALALSAAAVGAFAVISGKIAMQPNESAEILLPVCIGAGMVLATGYAGKKIKSTITAFAIGMGAAQLSAEGQRILAVGAAALAAVGTAERRYLTMDAGVGIAVAVVMANAGFDLKKSALAAAVAGIATRVILGQFEFSQSHRLTASMWP